MIKAVLFDIDNTLIDFMKMKRLSCSAALDAMIKAGLKINKSKGLRILYSIYKVHGIEDQRIFQKFLLKVNGSIDYRILVNGIIAYRKVHLHYLYPYPNTVSTLSYLKSKRFKLAVVSDAPRLMAWMRLVSLGLDKYFDVVVTAADVRKQKTSTAPFKSALKKLKVKPNEALMVGDRIERDILTAKKLGILTCYAAYGEVDKKKIAKGKKMADYCINDLIELKRIL